MKIGTQIHKALARSGADWGGMSCEQRRRASGGANENDSFMPPSPWQREEG